MLGDVMRISLGCVGPHRLQIVVTSNVPCTGSIQGPACPSVRGARPGVPVSNVAHRRRGPSQVQSAECIDIERGNNTQQPRMEKVRR